MSAEIKDARMLPQKTVVTQEAMFIAHPKPGIDFNDAKERWLAAKDDAGKECNRILDDGGRGQPVLLVGAERSRQMLFEIVPEATDENVRPEHILAGMRAAGYDVRGFGPKSKDGNPTVVVVEKY